MGPRSNNRGYGVAERLRKLGACTLQWVHGRITVVMCAGVHSSAVVFVASMGPRSNNRGYARDGLPRRARAPSFNGSTVE